MDPQIVILREVSQRQTTYAITYMWNLEKLNLENELIYKTEIGSQMQKTNLWSSRGKERRDKAGDWN